MKILLVSTFLAFFARGLCNPYHNNHFPNNNNPEHKLAKRARRYISYNDARCRGETHLHKLSQTTVKNKVEQSKWLKYSELEQHGFTHPGPTGKRSVALDTALRTLNLDPEGFTWWSAEHDEKRAFFEHYFNPETGAIFVDFIYGFDPAAPEMPSKWSDVVYLGWTEACAKAGTKPENLKWILQKSIQNTEGTLQIVPQALKNAIKDPAKFPGTYFKMDTEEGQTILGSPNGIGTAWLLLQHREVFGMKTVKGVYAFYTDADHSQWGLAFELEDSTPKPVGNDVVRTKRPGLRQNGNGMRQAVARTNKAEPAKSEW